MTGSQLAGAVANLARAATDDFAADDMLRQLCTEASTGLGADAIGVMGTRQGQPRFVAASHHFLLDLEHLQETLQTGPCRAAVDGERTVVVNTPAELAGWPEFAHAAGLANIQSVAAIPLLSRGQCWGVLELYWTAEHNPGEDDLGGRWRDGPTCAVGALSRKPRRE